MKIKVNKKIIKENRYWVVLALFIISSFAYYAYYLKENQLFPKASLYFIDNVEIPGKDKRVLVFSPHPDDETLGAGGFIYESIRKGADVKIILITDGNKHGLKDKRYAEFKEATGLLGVAEKNLVFLNYHDGELKKEDFGKLKNRFNTEIENYKPDILVYSFSFDQHPDHAKAGKIIREIAKEKGIRGYEYLVHYKRFPYPYRFRPDDYILPPVSFVSYDQRWVKLMLSSEAEDQKMEAILRYKTQLRYLPLRELLYSFVRKNEIFMVD